MARREFDRGWDAYERTEVYSDWVVAQKGLESDDSEPYYDVVYCKSMREATDREVNPEEEAHSLDPRGNYPNGACLPQGYWISDEDYGPSFLYDDLTAEAAAPRAPQVEIDASGVGHQIMAYCTPALVIDAKATSSTWPQQLGLASPQQ